MHEQDEVRFVMLPDTLPGNDPRLVHRYEAARRRMYQAQLEAATIAAEDCYPELYRVIKRKFQRDLLDLFSQTCDKVRR